jgi:hypothetical protein
VHLFLLHLEVKTIDVQNSCLRTWQKKLYAMEATKRQFLKFLKCSFTEKYERMQLKYMQLCALSEFSMRFNGL